MVHLREVNMSNAFNQTLHPKPEDLLQAEISMGSAAKEAQKEAQFDVRKCMNAMKTVGAALEQAVVEEDASAKFVAMLNEAARVSRLLMLRWGQNPEDRNNRWMINVIEKAIMPYLSGSKPLSDDMVDALASSLRERAVEHQESALWKSDPQVTLSLFKGLNLISSLQNEFDFMRKSKEQDLVLVRDKVLDQAAQAMHDLCPDLAAHEDRVVFASSLVEQLFGLFASSWKRNSLRARAALHGLNASQLKAWKSANPNGFELKPVFDHFEQNAGRLVRLTLEARKKDKK